MVHKPHNVSDLLNEIAETRLYLHSAFRTLEKFLDGSSNIGGALDEPFNRKNAMAYLDEMLRRYKHHRHAIDGLIVTSSFGDRSEAKRALNSPGYQGKPRIP